MANPKQPELAPLRSGLDAPAAIRRVQRCGHVNTRPVAQTHVFTLTQGLARRGDAAVVEAQHGIASSCHPIGEMAVVACRHRRGGPDDRDRLHADRSGRLKPLRCEQTPVAAAQRGGDMPGGQIGNVGVRIGER
jgi:hypothetical protein